MKKHILLGIGAAAIAGGTTMLAAPVLASNGHNYNAGPGGGANVSGQQRGHGAQLETKAKLLGMSVDELQKQLETKTVLEIAKSKGISEDKLHETVREQAKARWQSRGLSETEINNRLKVMETRQANCDGTGNNGHQHYGQR